MRLKTLLQIKIALTVALWCIPLLLFPSGLYDRLGLPTPEPLVFVRLLGVSFVALVVGYWMGLKSLASGENTVPVLNMGIASNGLAAIVLFYFGLIGEWSDWGTFARIYMWFSATAVSAITLGLLWFRFAPPSGHRRSEVPGE